MDKNAILTRSRDIQNEVNAIFGKYGDERVPDSEAPHLKALIDELEGLAGTLEGHDLKGRYSKMHNDWNTPANPMIHPRAGGGDGAPSGKSIGELLVESPAFKSFSPAERRGPASSFPVKALLDTATGWAPEAIRIPRIEGFPSRPLSVLDALAQGVTDQNAVVYMEETTSTSGAAETAEGAEKAESILAFTEKSTSVRTIATVLPVTNQLLEDVGAAKSYINERLAYFVRQRLDSQLINGDGAAPNLRGIMNTVNVQSQAKGADPTPDAIAKAMDLVRANGAYEPDFVLLHPNDWAAIRLLRTADGIYIWGNPSDAGVMTIWGKRVVTSTAVPENTGIVGARQAAMVFFRSDLQLAISDSHEDFFIRNQVMLRAEVRVAFACFRPQAFCFVTGI